ncbi:LrgB family protein [Clostridium oceanicum]|uniref:LrgB family protein n=1 Tax=Clostridium oceanicum TaxID=1543 RepID=A0ABP3UQ44_9CLOT
MSEIITSPFFGILISLVAFEIGCFAYKKTKLSLFNPLFISILFIIVFLKTCNINLNSYNVGGNFISLFLTPATVILAVPLYKKLELLKQNSLAILIGITSGTILGLISIVVLGHIFKLDTLVNTSIISKSITVPISLEVSKQLGGIPALTASVTIFTGILGTIIGPIICKLFKIKEDIAVGVVFGTASHAIGTTKAMEIGQTEGAMSSLSIGIAGLMTVFLAPIIYNVLTILFN